MLIRDPKNVSALYAFKLSKKFWQSRSNCSPRFKDCKTWITKSIDCKLDCCAWPVELRKSSNGKGCGNQDTWTLVQNGARKKAQKSKKKSAGHMYAMAILTTTAVACAMLRYAALVFMHLSGWKGWSKWVWQNSWPNNQELPISRETHCVYGLLWTVPDLDSSSSLACGLSSTKRHLAHEIISSLHTE